uniref:PDZ domain-containing protein n=1 Tax=Rhodosorus marinus TaxID=101924 RepID=A0A7S2ZL78_9RHOD
MDGLAFVGSASSAWTGGLRSRRSLVSARPNGSFVLSGRPVAPVRRREDVKCSVAGTMINAGSSLAGLAVLALTILVHEAGHYLAARSRGIEVDNFSVGFGPALWSFTPKGSETKFTLRAIPLGGFVSFPPKTREDPETGEMVESDNPNLLQNRPVSDRVLVVSAGVIANIVLAWTSLFVSVSAFGVPTLEYRSGVVVTQVLGPESYGAKSGILPGDVILSMDGKAVQGGPGSAGDVASTIRTSEGRTIVMEMQRGQEVVNLDVKPKCCSPNGESLLGVQLQPRADMLRLKTTDLDNTLRTTTGEFMRLTNRTTTGLKDILTNFGDNAKNVSGPIGVVSMGADLARNDQASLLAFCAAISMNLAIINSLPLPALDGGQMVFLLAEAVRGSPVSTRWQEAVNRTALLMFLTFSGFLLLGDIAKLNLMKSLQQLFG